MGYSGWQHEHRRNRNDVTFDEWMDMDMRYIRDRSFLLDWKLIFGTVWTVFAGTGE